MQIQVYGTLRLMTGQKTIPVDVPSGASLRHLLMELVRAYPALRSALFDEDGSLSPNLPLFVNGRNPRLLPASIEMILQPDDVVSLFSPYASGRMDVKLLRDLSVSKRSRGHKS